MFHHIFQLFCLFSIVSPIVLFVPCIVLIVRPNGPFVPMVLFVLIVHLLDSHCSTICSNCSACSGLCSLFFRQSFFIVLIATGIVPIVQSIVPPLFPLFCLFPSLFSALLPIVFTFDLHRSALCSHCFLCPGLCSHCSLLF